MKNILSPVVICLIFSLLASLLSCQKEKTELDLLYDEVMTIHDDVMPKMRNIRKEIKNGEKVLESLSPTDTNSTQELNLILKNLKKAEKGMWDWMHNFDKSKYKVEDKEKGKAYLMDEKIKISNVRDMMLSSLKKSSDYHEKKDNNE